MRRLNWISLFLLPSMLLHAFDLNYHASQYNALSYESEQTSLYSSLYHHLQLQESFAQHFWVQASLKLTNSYSNNEENMINRAMVSDLNAGYIDSVQVVSLGRNELVYDWMMGSFDGIVYNGTLSDTHVTLFGAIGYEDMLPNYDVPFTPIHGGVVGSIVEYQREGIELIAFEYYLHQVRSILGGEIDLRYGGFGIDLYHTWLYELSEEAPTGDEHFSKLSLYYTHNHHTIELGSTYAYDNGLLKLFEYGSMGFESYYLGSAMYEANALNLFASYALQLSSFDMKLLAGVTQESETLSYEYNLNLGYQINRDLYLSSTIAQHFGASEQSEAVVELGYYYE
jgi:hypothetical protein